ncbi:Uncharacterised protein [Actinomyces bovis]|uniref:Transcriptional regulator n=1 Tax=Actinomyces bovis TaxID=1658 RepID=A0ABY1VN69_9ACTO|nr:transcriptional regulator [Actinomyces bovis]SPT53500.1 Uncharacterised protein [Actinomyces bovis]VEG55414.1 Uncharacterised protein [Actinomyces israelii]
MAEPARYLGLSALAERAGISRNTASSYAAGGYLPPPDALIIEGAREVRGWLPSTVDQWLASRPGRGARTDLRKPTT